MTNDGLLVTDRCTQPHLSPPPPELTPSIPSFTPIKEPSWQPPYPRENIANSITSGKPPPPPHNRYSKTARDKTQQPPPLPPLCPPPARYTSSCSHPPSRLCQPPATRNPMRHPLPLQHLNQSVADNGSSRQMRPVPHPPHISARRTSEEPLSPTPDGRTPAEQGSPRQLHPPTCLCPPLEDGCSPGPPPHRFNCQTPGSCGKHTARSCISPARQTLGCLRRHADSFLPTRQTAPGSLTK